MIDWNYIIIGLSILLLILLIIKEVRRKNRARLMLRLVATIGSVICLACMALSVSYHHTKANIITNQAVLLTEGANADSVNSFLSKKNNDIPVFTNDHDIKAANKVHSTFITDVAVLNEKYRNINTFHVFGYGLEKSQLEVLKNVSLIFHQIAIPAGIIEINWSHVIKTGEKLFVQGHLNNPTSTKIKVVLTGFNTSLDSTYITGSKHENFQLTITPKHNGIGLYQLSVVADKDTIEKESIPVQVQQGKPPAILLLANTPDFENKFLQTYLSRRGYTVVTRTAISKNKYLKNFQNTTSISIDRITRGLLDKFDIVVADTRELASISKPELAVIQTQVAQKSMGLIIKADSVISGAPFYSRWFPLTTLKDSTEQSVRVYISDTTTMMPATSIQHPIFIQNAPGTQPVAFNKQERIFANTVLYGSGKIILSTLTNTYNWALSGNNDDYEKYWSTLINKASSRPAADEVWRISPSIPQINKPVQLQVEKSDGGLPQAQVNGTSVYLQNNTDLPFSWSGTYYPIKKGWQSSIQLNGNIFYWYAYSNDDWKSISAMRRAKETKQYISEKTNAIEKEKTSKKTGQSEVPKIYFALSFLICAGFLWLEDKISYS